MIGFVFGRYSTLLLILAWFGKFFSHGFTHRGYGCHCHNIVNEADIRNACERVDMLYQENVELMAEAEVGGNVVKIKGQG